jgi:N-methylhydantoinase A
MILGLDVGGTQTDAVLIDKGIVAAETKTPTGDDLIGTLRSALDLTLGDADPAQIERMVFSTTMATNAIVQNCLEPVGMIVSAGPGMDPNWFSVGPSYHVVEGCLDHQGFEALPLNENAVMEASRKIRKEGIRLLGAVSKFSVRNPDHELQMADWLRNDYAHITLGHRVSGSLNFPRRITTTYLNAALYDVNLQFANALISILREKNIYAPSYLLKPDGGTFDLQESTNYPARTAQSGPAASVMGALALDGCKGTCLVLDIGGTTTDMAVVLDGIPLRAPYGIRLGTFRTLIRSLLTRSIGVGGDSEVQIASNRDVKVGPLRRGRPMATGGPVPTPTDALITLGLLDLGDAVAARKAMEQLGIQVGWDAEFTARRIVEGMAKTIADSVNAFLYYLNSRPVYTIHEVLQEEKIIPTSVLVIGGPAPQVAEHVGKALGMPYRVPPHFGVANAVGAAVARVTSEVTLQADTERGTVVIPEAKLQDRIDYRFGLDDAISLARDVLITQAVKMGADPLALEISLTEKQVFNMIRGYSRTGQNIRLRMCITPGLIPEWERSR